MCAYSIDFLREHVKGLVGGDAIWVRKVDVPKSWWREYQRPSQVPSLVVGSAVHVFNIRRTEKDIREASLKWMGITGAAYVWTYSRDHAAFYTAVFADKDTPDGPEAAVRLRARQFRPWKLKKKIGPTSQCT